MCIKTTGEQPYVRLEGSIYKDDDDDDDEKEIFYPHSLSQQALVRLRGKSLN